VRSLAVLDRTKEPGAVGDPLYLEVLAALREAADQGLTAFANPPQVVGGRYGLSSKEFDPPMVQAVFKNLAEPKPRNHFTIGITDDVTHLSLPWDMGLDIEPPDVKRAIFYGLGADGTVGANKNSIKIIGEETPFFTQCYFVYDSKKSGATTVSHLRFGPRPIRSAYLVKQAGFVACHQFEFVEKVDVLEHAAPGGVFLLNSPHGPSDVWDQLPTEMQAAILEKHLRFYVIDAVKSRATTAWAAVSTRSCRPASSRSPACCPARRPSPRSSAPSRRHTASAAARW
jgi:pyruvate-ferredoxin/flavodoxin oxidoreductase